MFLNGFLSNSSVPPPPPPVRGVGGLPAPGGLQRELANRFTPPPFFRLRGSGRPLLKPYATVQRSQNNNRDQRQAADRVGSNKDAAALTFLAISFAA